MATTYEPNELIAYRLRRVAARTPEGDSDHDLFLEAADALAAVPVPTEADREAVRTALATVAFSGSGEEIGTEEFVVPLGDAAEAVLPLIQPAPKTQDGEAREALAVVKQTVWHKDQFYVTIDTDSEECVTISEELLVKLMTESGWVLVPSEPATPVFEAMGLPPVPPFPSIHPEGGE